VIKTIWVNFRLLQEIGMCKTLLRSGRDWRHAPGFRSMHCNQVTMIRASRTHLLFCCSEI
jgi:hypothetical protein